MAHRFLFWFMTFLISLTGIYWAGYFGFLQSVWINDITMVTSLIAALFIYCQVILFRETFPFNVKRPKHGYETVWFLSETAMGLGLAGTVLGLIYMLTINFSGNDLSSLKDSLPQMWQGLGLALYTNAVGIIVSLVLKFQVFFISRDKHGAS